MDGDAAGNASHFYRRLLRKDLPRVIRIISEAVETKVCRHTVTVQGPARTVQHGCTHRRTVQTLIIFLNPVVISFIRIHISQQKMPQTVRLGLHTVSIIGNQRSFMSPGQIQQRRRHLVQCGGKFQQLLPLH